MNFIWAHIDTLAPLFVLLSLGGALGGLFSGLLGIGGGIILVPLLTYIFSALDIAPEINIHLAIGTSLGSMIITGSMTVYTHWRYNAINFNLIKESLIWVILGVCLGALISSHLSSHTLTIILATFLLCLAINMMFDRQFAVRFSKLPPTPFWQICIFFIGTLSSLLGIGGGALTVPLLTLCNYPIHKAIGTSCALGWFIAVFATFVYIIIGWNHPGRLIGSLGYVNLLSIFFISSMSILMARLSSQISHRINAIWLKRIFAIFLMVISLRLIWVILWT